MSRLIDADAFCEALEWADADVLEEYADGYSEWGYTRYNIKDIVGRMPTVDPESLRPHGRWIVRGQDVFCSECKCESGHNAFGASSFSDYCPNCGAIMDGDK